MDRLRAIAAKIIADYKEHYDFPWQGESHMEDCIMAALQSLSQEAVREEVLEEVAQMAQDRAASEHDDFSEFAHDVRALKREPNAAGQPRHLVRRGLKPDGTYPLADDDEPAPAAPDVAEMVKRLEGRAIGLDGGIYMYEADAALMRQAATLLARLGQGWIPVSERLPEDGAKVLIFHDDSQHVMNFHANEKEFWEEDGTWFIHLSGITHWMPLPPAP